MTERELLERLKQGDRGAFRTLYDKTRAKLLQWVLAKVENTEDAEELVQDTYLAFLDSLPLFRGDSSLWTFLVAIARHEVADYWRKKYAKRAIQTVPFVSELYTEKLYASVIVSDEIERVSARLLPQEVVILRLKYEEGRSLAEIARQLNISLKAAESRLFRARKAFVVAYETVVGD